MATGTETTAGDIQEQTLEIFKVYTNLTAIILEYGYEHLREHIDKTQGISAIADVLEFFDRFEMLIRGEVPKEDPSAQMKKIMEVLEKVEVSPKIDEEAAEKQMKDRKRYTSNYKLRKGQKASPLKPRPKNVPQTKEESNAAFYERHRARIAKLNELHPIVSYDDLVPIKQLVRSAFVNVSRKPPPKPFVPPHLYPNLVPAGKEDIKVTKFKNAVKQKVIDKFSHKNPVLKLKKQAPPLNKSINVEDLNLQI